MMLAIWGSCATRDVFEIDAHPFELENHARPSWVSQASIPQAPVWALPTAKRLWA